MTLVAPYSAHWALYPRSYNVIPTDPFEIDGNIEKLEWQKAKWSEPFGDIQGKDAPPDAIPPALTKFKAMYDETHLYIAAVLHPSDHFGTQAHFTERNSPIYQRDSDFEVFIDVINSHHYYKEFEVNALNTVWNLMLDKPYMDDGQEHSGRIHKPGDPFYYEVYEQKSATKVVSGRLNESQGALWTVEAAFAYSDLFARVGELPNSPSKGDLWRVNFSRVELQGDVNWTWQPQIIWDGSKFCGKVNMHLPDAWGYFTFNQDGLKDNLWPAKLTAMHIYYAQHLHKERFGKYASNLADLDPFADADIVSPFKRHLSMTQDENSFEIKVPFNEKVVSVTQDRRMTTLIRENELR